MNLETETEDSLNNENQTKSKQRIAEHGEVFTAKREVNAMLDLVKQETERIDSRFLKLRDCGNLSVMELEAYLEKMGLSWSMDV